MSIYTFRKSNESDAQAIAELVNRAYRPAYGAAGWTHESDLVVGDRTNPDQVTETITRPNSVILVGLNASKIVACVHIEKKGGNSHIGMLAVPPTLKVPGQAKKYLHKPKVMPLKYSALRNSAWLLCPQEENSFPFICAVAISQQAP